MIMRESYIRPVRDLAAEIAISAGGRFGGLMREAYIRTSSRSRCRDRNLDRREIRREGSSRIITFIIEESSVDALAPSSVPVYYVAALHDGRLYQ